MTWVPPTEAPQPPTPIGGVQTPAPTGGTQPPPPTAPPVERFVHLPYQRLYRAQPTYRWWRPLVALLLLGVWIFLVTTLLLVAVFFVVLTAGGMTVDDPVQFQNDLLGLVLPDMSRPETMVLGLGSVAIWLPGVPIALRLSGIRPAGPRTNITHSVTFRLRWGWLARCLVPAVVVTAVSIGASVGLGFAFDGAPTPATIDIGRYLVSLLLVLLLVPFQAAAEEYVFRGMLLQALGAWVPWVGVALILPTVLFALGHIYDIWGLLDVAVFGIAAAVATWRTGGLEAAIAMHAVNNIAAFALLGSGVTGETGMTATGSSPVSISFTVVSMAAFLLWVEFLAKRRGVARLSNIRIVSVPTPPLAPAG